MNSQLHYSVIHAVIENMYTVGKKFFGLLCFFMSCRQGMNHHFVPDYLSVLLKNVCTVNTHRMYKQCFQWCKEKNCLLSSMVKTTLPSAANVMKVCLQPIIKHGDSLVLDSSIMM